MLGLRCAAPLKVRCAATLREEFEIDPTDARAGVSQGNATVDAGAALRAPTEAALRSHYYYLSSAGQEKMM
jgi:hypothetical protein